MVIDTHQHFWKYNREEYGWIPDEWSSIQRDFLPEHLHQEIQAAGVDAVVAVQARQSLEETRWLLELADQNTFIKGVVGWVPLASRNLRDELEKIAGNKKLRGVRHVVQGENDPEFMLRPPFEAGIRTLKDYGLAYDILILESQLEQAIRFIDRHPNQTFILDHIAKPKIRESTIEPWRSNILEIAKRPHIYCKISGMVNEADIKNWNISTLQPYFDTVLEAFGPERLMFGSDWPVCTPGVAYKDWANIVHGWVKNLSAGEKDRIFSLNALLTYNL